MREADEEEAGFGFRRLYPDADAEVEERVLRRLRSWPKDGRQETRTAKAGKNTVHFSKEERLG